MFMLISECRCSITCEVITNSGRLLTFHHKKVEDADDDNDEDSGDEDDDDDDVDDDGDDDADEDDDDDDGRWRRGEDTCC